MFYCGPCSHSVWNSCYLMILCLIPYCSSEFLSNQVSYLISGSGQWEGECYHRINDCSGFQKHCLDLPESLISSILLFPVASAVPFIPRLSVIQALRLKLPFLSGSLIVKLFWYKTTFMAPVIAQQHSGAQLLGASAGGLGIRTYGEASVGGDR